MKHKINAILLLLFSECVLIADVFLIGDQILEISPPKGYVRVTSEMENLYRYTSQLEDPYNDLLAYYISES